MLHSVLTYWGTALKHLSWWKVNMQWFFKDVYRANNYCRRNGTAFNIDSEKHICCKPSMYMKQVRKVKNSQRHQGVAACRWFTRLLLLQVPFCQCLWNDSLLLVVFATFKIVGSGSTHELYVKVASELFGLLKQFQTLFLSYFTLLLPVVIIW